MKASQNTEPQRVLSRTPCSQLSGAPRGHSLALRLLGDVADGGALLADDGADVLRGHQQPQGDVGVRLGGHPGARGAPAGPPPGPVATATVVGPPLAALLLRGLVGDVGDAQSVVLELVPVQLLDGSEGTPLNMSSRPTTGLKENGLLNSDFKFIDLSRHEDTIMTLPH